VILGLPLIFLPSSLLIQGGLVVDGLGGEGRIASVRVKNHMIVEVGNLTPLLQESVIDATGMVVSPGFIDAHSHAAGGILKEPSALSQLTQGITTAVVGQDGGWDQPLEKEAAEIGAVKPSLNFAFFSGHGGIRRQVMGSDYKRAARDEEIDRMSGLVDADMKWGAVGMSSGLEYDPGYYSTTSELMRLAKAIAPYKGVYISHVRDEADSAFTAFSELVEIGKGSRVTSQISHIKLGSSSVWNRADDALRMIDKYKIYADVYPYLYWQSTIAALVPSRDWEDRKIWEKGLADVGGPHNVRLTKYTPDRSWEGYNLEELGKKLGRDPISIIQEILRKTTDGEASQSVVVTAMQESDLVKFIRHPRVMFCSDGSIGGSHPRGAGSFPRVLGRYVREMNVLSLGEAIRKMTSLPATVFGLKGRGVLRPQAIADICIFNANTITDRATPDAPKTLSVGVRDVMVNGEWVLRDGRVTTATPGQMVKRGR
jgi:N-acyl-D-amino-acid deacylase